MINTEKVKLMARTIHYEESSTGDNIRLRSYCGSDSRRFTIRTALTGAVVYLLMAAVIFVAFGADVSGLEGKTAVSVLVIAAAVLVGALFTYIYVRVVRKTVSSRYRNVRSSMTGYDLHKRKLRQITQEGKTENNSAE